MPPRKIRGSWHADFWFDYPDGRRERIRKKAPLNTEASARDFERVWVKNALIGNPAAQTIVEKGVPTLEAYVPRFMTSSVGNKRNSYKDKETIFRLHLLPRFGARRLDEITVDDIDAFKADYTGELGFEKKTVNNHLIVLNALLKKAFDDGVVPKRVRGKLFKVRAVKDTEFKFLTFDEKARLLQAGRKDPADYEWYCMILCALQTGMRIGELLALKWSSVDLIAGRLVVRERFHKGILDTPKSGQNREIPLEPGLVSALRALKHLRGQWVFCDERGEPHKWAKATWGLQRVARRAGLEGWDRLGFHELRHTFASHLVMKGAPLKAVQELLGHATIELTLRYAHLSPEVKKECIMLLSDAPSGSEHPRDE